MGKESSLVVTPDEDLGQAVDLMREHSIRHPPVVEEGHPVGLHPVGIVSLGGMAKPATAG
ncbi:CBS domain-containing protein [Streptomyces sp. NPDC004546]|uniref:CBS domain-containing protein n=1 Tax=unclassified Streptomyces TaxID=2593676 RepID=UPI0033A1FF72